MTDDGGCNPPTPAEREAKLRLQIRKLESEAGELRDRMDVMTLEHEETKGYRQHAERQLAEARRIIAAADAMRLELVIVFEHDPNEVLAPDEEPCKTCKSVAAYDAVRKELPW